jgi:hypothetical protein
VMTTLISRSPRDNNTCFLVTGVAPNSKPTRVAESRKDDDGGAGKWRELYRELTQLPQRITVIRWSKRANDRFPRSLSRDEERTTSQAHMD